MHPSSPLLPPKLRLWLQPGALCPHRSHETLVAQCQSNTVKILNPPMDILILLLQIPLPPGRYLPNLGTVKPCPKSSSCDSAPTLPPSGLGAGSSFLLPGGAPALHSNTSSLSTYMPTWARLPRHCQGRFGTVLATITRHTYREGVLLQPADHMMHLPSALWAHTPAPAAIGTNAYAVLQVSMSPCSAAFGTIVALYSPAEAVSTHTLQ